MLLLVAEKPAARTARSLEILSNIAESTFLSLFCQPHTNAGRLSGWRTADQLLLYHAKPIPAQAAAQSVCQTVVTSDARLRARARPEDILGSGGSKSRAFSIHEVTCAVMLVVGLLLIDAERNASDRSCDREGRIAISHAGVVDPLVFEADIDALLAE